MLKQNKSYSPLITFITISLVVFLTRVPFLLPGYGTDTDAWGVVYTAKLISATHQYTVSRFPGYPLQELTYALLWRGGPFLLNGITAIMSGFAAGFLALAGKETAFLTSRVDVSKINAPILGALIFAFTPVIYINSVNSMDYLWAIAFILGSLYFSLVNKNLLAGLFLGLAIGTRVTSGLMLIPLSLVFLYQGVHRKDVVRFTLISIIVGGLFYIPALATYGIGFFKYHRGGQIPLTSILSKATIEIWGRIGFGILIIAIFLLLWRLIKSESLKFRFRNTAFWKIWLIAIALYILLFFFVPYEAAYLIPLVPFTILLFQEFLTKKMLLLLCFAVICSSLFIEIYPSWQVHAAGFDQRFRSVAAKVRFSRLNFFIVPLYGSLLYDHTFRTDEINRFTDVFAYGNNLRERSVILVGWNLPKFVILAMNKNKEIVFYRDFLDKDTVQGFINHGIHVYYLPEILPASIELYDVDFKEFEFTPIDIWR